MKKDQLIKTDYQETVLIDDMYLTSLLSDIEDAKSSIDIEVYIFEADHAGKQIADALCHAAKRNVKVRVLVDGIGTITWGNHITKQMENADIKTKVFHPLPWIIWHWGRAANAPDFIISKIIYLLSKINSRNHRKVCIIDKHIVYVGSANITDHLLRNEIVDNCWRDTSVRLVDVNIDKIQYAFEKAWNHIPFKKRLRSTFQIISPEPIFRLNYSWRRRHILYKSLLSRISHCKKRIWVTNAYFVPDSYLLNKLIEASQRGVDVRILLPAKSDVWIASLASTMFYTMLLKNGVLIYEYLPTMLHAKVLILDDWYSVGSSNLNYRSLRHDLEVDVNVRTPEAKGAIDRQFLYDLSQSQQLHLDVLKKQPLYKRLVGYLILFIRYWI